MESFANEAFPQQPHFTHGMTATNTALGTKIVYVRTMIGGKGIALPKTRKGSALPRKENSENLGLIWPYQIRVDPRRSLE